MGYSTRGSITDYTPDNDKDTLYVRDSYMSVCDLLDSIKNHFGDNIDYNTLNISSEKIHTRCIYYDLHDEGDWDNYIVIKRLS